MTLPALATVDQLEARLGSLVEDVPRALAVLEDASTLVRAEAGATWVTAGALVGVPDIVTFVTLAAARRAYENPTGITQKTAGDISISYAGRSATAVYLTVDEKALIRQTMGRSGLYTVSVTRDDPSADTVYVPIVGTEALFPWYAADDPLVFG